MVDVTGAAKTEIATLAGGCFWCLEAVYQELRGVTHVISGYAGGHVDNPTYEQVCSGRTGHAEVVQITFDPDQVTYADVLRVFFTIHDPTTLNRQGNDVGTQYRSAIFTHSPEQQETARQIIAELTASALWNGKIVTEIQSLSTFYPAEEEHHNYYLHHPNAGCCRVIVAPKVVKFRKTFADRIRKPM